MKTPYTGPVGITIYPDEFSGCVRPASARRRLLAAVVLVVFGFVVVATTVLSLGAYCLTSHGGDVRGLW